MEDIDIIEQLTPGTIDGLGIVLITEKESTIPHFDIIRSDGSKVSIMILDNRYMDYTESVLTNEECKMLDEWSKGKSDEQKEPWKHGDPNWYHMILCWDSLYNDYEIGYDENYISLIPNYTLINHY